MHSLIYRASFLCSNLSSQITQPREPPPPDSVKKLPKDWGLWPRVSGFLIMRPNQDQGEKTDFRQLSSLKQLRLEVEKKVLQARAPAMSSD